MRGIRQSDLEESMETILSQIGFIKGTDFASEYCLRTKYGYRLDFAFPQIKLGIECDGEYWHQPNNHHDIKRDGFFKGKGWTILRFTGIDIINNPNAVKDKINEVIKNEENNSKN